MPSVRPEAGPVACSVSFFSWQVQPWQDRRKRLAALQFEGVPSPVVPPLHHRLASLRKATTTKPPEGARLLVAGSVVLLLVLTAKPAGAVEAEVTSTTAAQAYSLRSPFGDPVLLRRRFLQTIGLGLYDIAGDRERATDPNVSFKLRLRFDADPGIDTNERSFSRAADSRYVPGLSEAALDLMYGYLDAKKLAGGWLGFRLGRQYIADSLGWWSFDGGLVSVTAPYVKVEAYGGFEQRGGLPLSSGRYERSGVWRGDRSGALDGQSDIYPYYLRSKPAPAYGVAIESNAPYWVHGRLDYRKVLNTGEVLTTPYIDAAGRFRTTDQTRTSSERLGYSLDITIPDIAGLKAGLVYDLYNRLFSSFYGNVDVFAGQRVTASAEYDYFKPTFDADSIFNWFSRSAITTLTSRVSVNITDEIDMAASGGARFFETDDDPDAPALGESNSQGKLADPEANNPKKLVDGLGNLHGRYRGQSVRVGARGVFEAGERGRREGVDLSGEKDFSGGRYTARLRGSLFDWDDKLRADRSATSFGYVVGGAVRPADFAQVMLEFEHNMNRLVGQRYRVLAVVNLQVMP